ncbi:MAG: PH domain-containing protein [Clostridia bacterium]|nr:PH domain-containing protein [Clostridia bacterium]
MKDFDIEQKINHSEKIQWKGKPEKKAFFLKSVFNIFLPIAVVWAIIDFSFISRFINDVDGRFFVIPFFILHLMPVWMYLFGIISSLLRFRHTEYVVTDQAIYISGGAFTINVERKPLVRISNVSIRSGIIERMSKVGSIVIDDGDTSYRNNNSRMGTSFAILYVQEPEEVFNKINKLQSTAFSDTMYPNQYRPQ